jgi:hypothetical protein
VLVAALAGAFRRGEIFPRAMRLAVGGIALFFVALAAVGIFWLPLPPRFVVHLKTSQAFLAWFIAVALWRGPGPVRAKAGVTLFALPAILHAFAVFAEQAGRSASLPSELARASAICALVAGALSPYLLAPEPATPGRRAVGVAVGVVSLAGLLAALLGQFDLVQTVALFGFRLDLPPLASGGAIAYVGLAMAAFVGLAMALCWTLIEPGGPRLVGYGLALVSAAGYQTLSPNQVLFATCGLLAMAAGVSRFATPERPAAVSPVTAAASS